MDFELSEAQNRVRETARQVARDVVAPRADAIDENAEYPQDIYEAFREHDLLGLSIPKEVGGSGAGMFGLALAVEEVAKYCCASGLILLLSALSTQPIIVAGTEEQKQRWAGGVARGELRGSFALTEPTAGSDAAAIATTASRDGSTYVLNGQKMYVSGGTVADFFTVFAKTDPTAGARGISAFIVPKDTPGFRMIGTNRKMGVKGVSTANFAFENARVPEENLIGGVEGRGFSAAMLALNSARPVVGARGLGLAEGAMAYALAYAKERRAFGGPIIDLQAIQFMFADMAIAVESARLLVYQAALQVDQGRFKKEDAAYLSIAKAVASETAVKVSSDALQILGAQGYLRDHPLERHYRDARQLMIVEGTSQIQRVIISRAMIDGDLPYE